MINKLKFVKLTPYQMNAYEKLNQTCLADDFPKFLKSLDEDSYVTNGISAVSVNYKENNQINNFSLIGKDRATGKDTLEVLNTDVFKKILFKLKEIYLQSFPEYKNISEEMFDNFIKKMN